MNIKCLLRIIGSFPKFLASCLSRFLGSNFPIFLGSWVPGMLGRWVYRFLGSYFVLLLWFLRFAREEDRALKLAHDFRSIDSLFHTGCSVGRNISRMSFSYASAAFASALKEKISCLFIWASRISVFRGMTVFNTLSVYVWRKICSEVEVLMVGSLIVNRYPMSSN